MNNENMTVNNMTKAADKDVKKDTTKEKIILFVIGVLVGAVIASAAFLICVKTLGTTSNNSMGTSSSQQSGTTPPEMPSGQNGQGGSQNGQPQPPEASSNTNSGSSNSNNSNSSSAN